MPHGLEVALEVCHQEEGQQGEGHQVQQGRLGRLEHLKEEGRARCTGLELEQKLQTWEGEIMMLQYFPKF